MTTNCLYWLITSFIVAILFTFTFFRFVSYPLPPILLFKLIFLLKNSILYKLIIIVRSWVFIFFAFFFFVQRYSTSTSTRHSFVIKLLLLQPWSYFRIIKFRLLRRTSGLILRWRHLSFVCFFFRRHLFSIVKFV